MSCPDLSPFQARRSLVPGASAGQISVPIYVLARIPPLLRPPTVAFKATGLISGADRRAVPFARVVAARRSLHPAGTPADD
jgi:hypothetical protein